MVRMRKIAKKCGKGICLVFLGEHQQARVVACQEGGAAGPLCDQMSFVKYVVNIARSS